MSPCCVLQESSSSMHPNASKQIDRRKNFSMTIVIIIDRRRRRSMIIIWNGILGIYFSSALLFSRRHWLHFLVVVCSSGLILLLLLKTTPSHLHASTQNIHFNHSVVPESVFALTSPQNHHRWSLKYIKTSDATASLDRLLPIPLMLVLCTEWPQRYKSLPNWAYNRYPRLRTFPLRFLLRETRQKHLKIDLHIPFLYWPRHYAVFCLLQFSQTDTFYLHNLCRTCVVVVFLFRNTHTHTFPL